MRCEDLQLNLSLYFDDVLTSEERGVLDVHFDKCPLCRQKLVDFQEIRNGLRSFSRPRMSLSSLAALRTVAASNLKPAYGTPSFQLVDDRRNWFDVWLMPYAVGALSTLVVGFTLLWVMLAADFRQVAGTEGTASGTAGNSPVYLARIEPADAGPATELTPSEYANTRLAFSGESPSVNPRGALIALTRSLVRGEMRDDEVVVVADVFGNGLARIAEVVEPSTDDQAVKRLRKALESDPSYAPFVPADLDGRSQTIRVVLKIQNVNVSTR